MSLLDYVLQSLGKMAFVSGPRQVGKTTLARQYAAQRHGSQYFNWDIVTDQKKLLKTPYFFSEMPGAEHKLVIFDEIHKYARWKNYLKGAYDGFASDYQFLVTGSGRLDLFKKGGDSLLGRYFSVPLFPLTIGELGHRAVSFAQFLHTVASDLPERGDDDHLSQLMVFGGFPEPYVRQEQAFYRLWSAERRTLLIRGDIRDATRIREMSLVEMLAHLIPERVGSPLSYNSLREDLGVAFETVRDWVQVLAQFYYLFHVHPYRARLNRVLRKEAKVYLFDWAELTEPGPRFENLVALHLLKATKTWQAAGEADVGLYYLRDKEKREVDFVITNGRQPACLIEVKLSDPEPSKALWYFQERLEVPFAVQVVSQTGVLKRYRQGKRILWVASADQFLRCLP